MNKKIYFNDKFIEFTDTAAQNPAGESVETYTPDTLPALKKLVSGFLAPENKKSIRITGADFNRVFRGLKKEFRYIEAAGGFIQRSQEFLFIHRHGRWDLPKGKLEAGEPARHAAVRECEEECGVKGLVIKKQLSSTFHVYEHKGGYALKQTFWYHMQTDYTGELLPQLEEDIDQVRWFNREKIESTVVKDTYYTIADVVNEGLALTA